MESLHFQSANKLLRKLSSGEISAVDLMNQHLARIEAVNPCLNAIVSQNIDQAIEKAELADKAFQQGKTLGRLHGLPITIKDFTDVAGFPATYGTLPLKDHYPKKNGFCVQQLLSEGAIILGVTNVPELGAAFESDNLVYGRTNNPYDLTRTPGGSSGGEAAMIAAGGSPLGLGSDAGGSIRVPAHFCGIAGLKPTRGILSRQGVSLPPSALGDLCPIASFGPMARYVEDLALVLPILARYDLNDTASVPYTLKPYQAVRLSDLNIGLFLEQSDLVPQASIKQIVTKAADYLSNHCQRLEEVELPSLQVQYELIWQIFFLSGLAEEGMTKFHEHLGITALSPLAQAGKIHAAEADKVDLLGLYSRLGDNSTFKQTMHQIMQHYDVLIMPPVASTAKLHGTSFDESEDFAYAAPFNTLGWPCGVVRCGEDEAGLPIGVQVIGRPFEEHKVLAVMAALEQALGGFKPPKI